MRVEPSGLKITNLSPNSSCEAALPSYSTVHSPATMIVLWRDIPALSLMYASLIVGFSMVKPFAVRFGNVAS